MLMQPVDLICDADKGAIILAGGDSRRLGQPKALLDFGGLPLIARIYNRLKDRFNRITVVTDRPELFSWLPVEFTADMYPSSLKSPLRGIHAGLSVSNLSWQFVVACDMPFVNMSLAGYMESLQSGCQAIVPVVGSYYQPLHAFYHRSCLEIIEQRLHAGQNKVTGFYETIALCRVEAGVLKRYDPQGYSFMNINNWSDYEQARALVQEEEEMDRQRGNER